MLTSGLWPRCAHPFFENHYNAKWGAARPSTHRICAAPSWYIEKNPQKYPSLWEKSAKVLHFFCSPKGVRTQNTFPSGLYESLLPLDDAYTIMYRLYTNPSQHKAGLFQGSGHICQGRVDQKMNRCIMYSTPVNKYIPSNERTRDN